MLSVGRGSGTGSDVVPGYQTGAPRCKGHADRCGHAPPRRRLGGSAGLVDVCTYSGKMKCTCESREGAAPLMAKPLPLHLRLYREPHLIALVRLIGYDGLPVSEARDRMKALVAEYGPEKMKAAAREVIRV